MITHFRFIFSRALFLALIACYKPTGTANDSGKQIVENVGNGVSFACTFLEGITDNGTVVNACLIAEELTQVATFIATRFHRSVPLDKCEYITPEVCATKSEIGAGILFIANANAMRFRLDGGK